MVVGRYSNLALVSVMRRSSPRACCWPGSSSARCTRCCTPPTANAAAQARHRRRRCWLLAQHSKAWVRHRLDVAVLLDGDRATVRPFVYSVAAEAGLALAILAAASVLVTSIPGADQENPHQTPHGTRAEPVQSPGKAATRTWPTPTPPQTRHRPADPNPRGRAAAAPAPCWSSRRWPALCSALLVAQASTRPEAAPRALSQGTTTLNIAEAAAVRRDQRGTDRDQELRVRPRSGRRWPSASRSPGSTRTACRTP